MKTVTTAQMKEIEKRADGKGISYYQMMENAGTRAYETICKEYPDAKSILIVCGKGNNGGDGLVIARAAATSGKRVSVLLAEGMPVTKDAITNYKLLPEEVNVCHISDDTEYHDIIVDALYGTGFHGALRENGIAACEIMNGSEAPVISLDVPSGCNADNAEASEGAVLADMTIVFDSWKKVHSVGLVNCGKCVIVDIGIPEECHF